MTILVTGATGTVGSAVVRELAAAGDPARALARNPEKADDLRGYDLDVVIGDLAKPETLDDALRGVTAVFLLSPVVPEQPEWEGNVLDAVARSAGRPHIVKLAVMGFDAPATRMAENHRQVVERMRDLALAHTVVAPNGFMQNLLVTAATVCEQGAISFPARDGAVSHVDARDVAAVAAHVLRDPAPHDRAVYEVTGPEALTYAEVAARMSEVLGREVRYVDVPPEQARRSMLGSGLGEWTVDALVELHAWYAQGRASAVTDEVEKATGRPARRLEEFLRDHTAAFSTV